jgi:hydroxymethylpyrimidine/phosphomethylpyrimidine kinase
MPTPPVALTIAGSDSGGAAGIQADLRTFLAHGVFGASAVTALTAQNSHEVRDVHVPPPSFLLAQVEAVLDDLPVAAVKTGMLGRADVVETVAGLAASGRLPRLVVDPVLVDASGAALLDDGAVDAYRERLLPHAHVTTPNVHEAARLLGAAVADRAGLHDAARRLAHLGPRVVVVTGGHTVTGTADLAVDVMADRDADEVVELASPRIDSANTHGSGCSFASAVAAGLARGRAAPDAVAGAHAWVHAAIASSADWALGRGHGPLDHGVRPPAT